jgi:prevent-host-death family protein
MLIVTIAEAQEHFLELLARVAAGDSVVIAEAGKSVAQLVGPPMFPTTPEEVAATEPGRRAFIRDYIQRCEENGHPLAPDDPLREIAAGGQPAR